MAPGEIFPIVNCSDLGRTRGWYERVLAGVVEYQFPADGDPEYLTHYESGPGSSPSVMEP